MQSAVTEALPVLVVDDDSVLIRTLSDILRMNGYAPETAATAREGLELAASRPPALAVVDLRLPDMDGMELVAKLHALSALTEVVVLTGNATVESAVAALREKSVDYLVKPVQVDHFLRVTSVAAERWQRHRAEAALESRARQQEAVATFGQRAIGTYDTGDIFADAAALVASTLDLPLTSVLERRSDRVSLVLRAGHGWNAEAIGRVFPLPQDGVAGFDFPAAELATQQVVSGLSVVIPGPLLPYGVLAAHDRRARTFSQDDVHFLQAIAHIMGSAVERSRSETAFRQAQRLEAVGRLAGGVAHDFNNMLTAITGYGEMIRANVGENDPVRQDVEEILNAAGRAAALTRQLLAFSRQQVLQPRLVNINEIVGGMENMLRRLIGADIQFRTKLDRDLAWVKADPGQLEQVILNLCVNARDAMPDGGSLTIETANVELDADAIASHSDEAPGQYVMLAVSDTGIGMDAETKARIYEPFFTTKPPEKGTGLGLATVYGIVKQSGGDIWVYSELGHGSTFKVYLPHAVEVGGNGDTPEERPALARGTETVLLAEDEDAVRRLAQRVLERSGYTVLVARNGVEALKVAELHQQPIHLLITDMVMPTMNGRQLVARMRPSRPYMRTLYLSGYTDTAVVREGLLDGGEHFLQKPFTTETLTRKVREILDAGNGLRRR